MRINQGQKSERCGRVFDALVFGYYEGKKLLFAAKTRNSINPALRGKLMRKFAGLKTDACPLRTCREEDRSMG
jgi:hypothetical protein